MAQGYVGIDVSKDSLDCHLKLGDKHQQRQYANNNDGFRRIHRWLKKQCGREQPHVCIESTGKYSDAVATKLYELRYRVSVVNPSRPKNFGRSMMNRNKTDKADAYVLAMFCAAMTPGLWEPQPEHVVELRAQTRRRENLKTMYQQEKNRSKAGDLPERVMESITLLLQVLAEEIAALEKAIQKHISAHADLAEKRRLLVSIPGIAEITAAKLIAEIPWNTEFESARQLAAYAGVTPCNRESGTSLHCKARMSKTGNAHLRKALYMPAIVASRRNAIVAEFYQRRLDTGLPKKAAIGACMRKLLHLVYGVLKHGKPFDENYCAR